jgi:hypothetical protein
MGMQERSLNMDELKLEAAIQFGTITAHYEWFEEKDLEDMAKMFNKLWCDYLVTTEYGYFTEYLQDILNYPQVYIEVFKDKLAKEIGEWYGTFQFKEGLYSIDNGERMFEYTNATDLLKDWYDTIECEHNCGDADWSIEMEFIKEFC